MWKGINSCAFAYGQTGSGKSYSFFGYGANKGIVPMAAEKIFQRVTANTDASLSFQITFQMVEIYMEKINDLLVEPAKRSGNLEVKQTKDLIWVDGARKEPVQNYEQINKYMSMGDKNRSIASTAMNATSSRAHTIVTIEMVKVTKSGGKESKTTSILNLVDLAGSEKQNQAQTEGDRLKEGNAINMSLTALGNVISALADISTGKTKPGSHIPYRDSTLTRML